MTFGYECTSRVCMWGSANMFMYIYVRMYVYVINDMHTYRNVCSVAYIKYVFIKKEIIVWTNVH